MLGALTPDAAAAILFADIAVIMVVARVVGAGFKRIRQPAVVGEIVAGILLGESFLGAFPGNPTTWLFPPGVRPYLKVVAQLGLVIFMFIVGLELDTKLIRGKERLAGVISLSSITAPFALGLLLASAIYDSHSVVGIGPGAHHVRFLPFALFIGASMSITAFPVLARILTERGMYRTPLGTITLAAAAVDDIAAWSLLALVLAVVKSAGGGSGVGDLPRILLESIAFVAAMFLVIRPRLTLLADRYRRAGRLTPNILAVILVGVLFSAYVTSKIGIHSIFGAFLFGVAMPREDTAAMFHEILERLEQVSVLLLLPVFFVVAGLDANVRGLGGDALTQLPLILLVACAGKFLGATGAARAQGVQTRRAAAIGVLMNTRGLTELVILEVGKSFGILDERLFTMLVVMAVVTTVMTEPLLRLVYPDRLLQRDIAEAEKAALGIVDAYRVMVLVDDWAVAGPLVDLSVELARSEAPAEVVLTRVSQSSELELGGGLVAELAETAASVEEFAKLSGRVEAAGVGCVVRSHFSTDPVADIVQQAAATDADVLVVSAAKAASEDEGTASKLARLIEDVGCTVVVVAGGPERTTGPVVAQVDDGPNALAVVELAARAAIGGARDLKVALTNGGRQARRVHHWVERATTAGLRVAAVEGTAQTAEAALSVVPLADKTPADTGSADDAPTVAVRAARAAAGDELDRLLEKVSARPVGVSGGRGV